MTWKRYAVRIFDFVWYDLLRTPEVYFAVAIVLLLLDR